MRRKHIAISGVAILILLFLLLVFIFFNPYQLETTLEFAKGHLYAGAIFLVLLRILGMIIPMIPGGIVSFALIPVFGWFPTYIYTATGIFIGTSIAFLLAKIYKKPLLVRFVSLKRIEEVEKQLSGKKEFFALVAFRLFTVPVVDISSYVAGFTKISYKKFALATFLATLPLNLTFYFGETFYKVIFGKNIFIGIIVILILGSIYFIIKRYKTKLKIKNLKLKISEM